MTRIEALSLAIARHFESEPTWTTVDYGTHISSHSDGGWWIRDGGIWPENVEQSHIAMRLLKWLVVRDLDWMVMASSLMLARTNEDGKQHIEQHEQAIAEAFCKANNLEVE